ncbi:MAG TPA: CBS domain-containing protein [Chloroflexota bacterium]|jgi:CBS domain-containing protein|nr:CBS domain-containing protein [Chloroflexota bacterium]
MRVGEVMTTPPVTVPPEMAVAKVARTLLDKGVRAVPVIEQGRLIGIITETDLLVRNAHLHFPTYLGILENVLSIGGDRNLDDELRRVLAVSAREVMTADVRTAAPDDDLGEVAHEMVQRHLHAIPVVKDGVVEGMLFPSDVVRLVARD